MDKLYQAIKVVAKSKGIKASPQHDLYKMIHPYFINGFYSPREKNSEKIKVYHSYGVKYSYFDDLTLYIIEPDSDIKLTDKVRANSVIACKSIIKTEEIEYDFDGRDESYQQLAEKVFSHMERWYLDFEAEVKEKYGTLEKYFISNKEEYPRQAALVFIHNEKYNEAEECFGRMKVKLNSCRTVHPYTEEQKQRLIESNAEKWGEDEYLRDDMDCHFDFIIAKKKGLEWTAERARYGLLNKERV